MKEPPGLLEKLTLTILLISIIFLMPKYVPCNPHGDEAWYYYITKELKWDWDPHLPFLPPLRWSFMITFNPVTDSLWTLRFAYAAFNVLVTSAAVLLAWNGRWGSLALALSALLNPLFLTYSSKVFTSVPAGAAGALSAALAIRGKVLSAVLLGIYSVGMWEGMTFFYLGLSLYGIRDRRFLLFLIPASLGLATSLDNVLFHKRLPGWAKAPLDAKAIVTLFLPEVLVLLHTLIKKRDLLLFLISFSLPAGLLLDNYLRGTAVQVWYQVPAHLLYSVAIANSLGEWKGWKYLGALIILAFIFIGTKAASSLKHDCCAFEIVDFLKVRGEKAVLYKPFWAYAEYPFGEVKKAACWDLGCLKWWLKRSSYVVSWEELRLRKLELVYKGGKCYLYKKVKR
ncbi:hypothetical protein [Ignicoccus hospitalis]|uniref:Uncharacterized protein n=1 Tax=Ignicoccus hospitalis (strain KIN4/I / DSM 18386 / JCM 14125) TaxID=453591 RepID=A8AB29_IGNH4|nr:hypothetical protein [Ignicoccus hospitalis]ABU82131.1 hypothetical protein Igni_0951 [Ignicoccus hospitalis KIN4/I]HIH91089.1 hypothetical protein [Desulfurococcaceae archaeon]